MLQRSPPTALALLLLALALAPASPELLVAPGQCLHAALAAARASGERTVTLLPGTHRLLATLQLTEADSGLTLRGAPGATLDGSVPLPPFTPRADGLWATALPPALLANASREGLGQLFVNGQRRLRARAPNALGLPPYSFPALFGDAAMYHMAGPLQACTLPAFGACPPADSWGFLANASEAPPAAWRLQGAWLLIAQAWLMEWVHAASYNASSGRVALAEATRDPVGAYGAARGTPSGGRWLVEGVREALDAPGEFLADPAAQTLLYYPLPGEAPDALNATMPGLTTLVRVAGASSSARAENITLQDLTLAHFGEGGEAARAGYWSYAGGLEVGPHAAGALVLRVAVRSGGANGVGIAGDVQGVELQRISVRDVGGRGVGGLGSAAQGATVSAFTLANSTLARAGSIFLGGAALVGAVGMRVRVVHNDLSDSPYSGVTYQQPGGPARAAPATPVLDISYNRIAQLGQGVLSDLGGVYLSSASDAAPATNWLAADVHHNVIANASCYGGGGYGANGVYSDHATSGLAARANALLRLGGRGLSLHCGYGLLAAGNLLYDIGAQAFGGGGNEAAVSGCTGAQARAPGMAANVSGNIVATGPRSAAAAYAPQDALWAPPEDALASDANVWWSSAGLPPLAFPGAGSGTLGSLAAWAARTGNDRGSVAADPMLRDPEGGDFTVLPGSPAWALGWKELDLSSVGPVPE